MHQEYDEYTLEISLSAKGIGEYGMLGIGWGGDVMSNTKVRLGGSYRCAGS